MIQFYDLPVELPVPLADRSLVCPLPNPPVCYLGGVAHIVERVKISDLEAWKAEHGLRLVRGTDLGQHGTVAVYAYENGTGEDDDRTAV